MSTTQYALEDLSRHRRPLVQKAGMRVDVPGNAPSPLPLDKIRIAPRLRKLIRDGFNPQCGFHSRSELDYAVISAMLRSGHSDEEICAVLMNPQYMISEKFFEKGTDGPRYLALTISSAKNQLAKGQSAGIQEQNGQLEVRRKQGQSEIIFTRPIKAKARLTGEENGFVVQIDTPRGTVERVLKTEHFANSFHFKKAIQLAGAWTGTDRDLQLLILHLEGQAPPVQEVVKTIGWRNGKVIFPNAQLDHGQFVSGTGYLYMGKLKDAQLEEHANWDLLAKELTDILPQLHTPQAMIPIIGWFMATFVAPQIRKLDQGAFPLLTVFGTPESGKTTILEYMQRLCGLNGALHSSSNTRFANIELLSSTNTLPIVFDEHRRSDVAKHKSNLYTLLREAYKAGIHTRGKPDLSLLHYHLTAPVAIGGETPFRDTALLDRTVHAQLERSGKNAQALERLRQLDVDKFNAGMYRHMQSKDVAILWAEVAKQLPAELQSDSMNVRQFHGWQVVALGLRLLEPFWSPQVADDLIKKLSDFRAASMEDLVVPTKAVVLEACRAIFELMKSKRIKSNREFAIKVMDGKKLLWFVPAAVLPLVEEYFQRIDTDLPMARETMLGRMREDAHSADPIVARYQEHFRMGKKTAKGIAIDLDRYAQETGIPAETWLETELEYNSVLDVA